MQGRQEKSLDHKKVDVKKHAEKLFLASPH